MGQQQTKGIHTTMARTKRVSTTLRGLELQQCNADASQSVKNLLSQLLEDMGKLTQLQFVD